MKKLLFLLLITGLTQQLQAQCFADAGDPDKHVCVNEPFVTLTGAANHSDIIWSSSGTGTFTPGNTVNSTYQPSAQDYLNGQVTLTLTNQGSCPVASRTSSSSRTSAFVSDNIIIYFDNPLPTLTVSGPTGMCSMFALTSGAALSGTTDGATFAWTTDGHGSYISGNANQINSTYRFGGADVDQDVHFTGTATSALGCVKTADLTVHVMQRPFVNTVSSFNVCREGLTYIDVSIINKDPHSTMLWENAGTGGTFSMGANGPTDRYILSASERAANAVTVTAVVTGTGVCGGVNDAGDITIFIHNAIVADAGADVSVCGNVSSVPLTGTGSGTTHQWTSNGSGTIINDASLTTAVYNFSPSEMANGASVKVYLTALKPSSACLQKKDSMELRIDRPVLKHDLIVAQAGVPASVNVLSNDSFYGQSYTISLIDNGDYTSDNSFTFAASTGNLSYLNHTTFTETDDVNDTLRYRANMASCGVLDTFVLVKLVNGPPFISANADADTSFNKKNTLISFKLDLSVLVGDYNNNIDWSTLDIIANLNGATLTHDLSDPDWLITVTYSSARGAVFTGADVIVFEVEDTYHEKVGVRYTVNIVPDYTDPSVSPDDFVVINAVSPNGDGVNDFMYIYGISEYHCTVAIYNRWGFKVWEGDNYDNNLTKFEGKSNVYNHNTDLDAGTYYYFIRNNGKDENGEKQGLHSGFLEVRR